MAGLFQRCFIVRNKNLDTQFYRLAFLSLLNLTNEAYNFQISLGDNETALPDDGSIHNFIISSSHLESSVWKRIMLNPITLLLGTSLFIPHGHCYLWKPELVGLHILSDALIAFAYYSIPLTLFYFVHRRRDLPFTWIFLLFSAFIIACGTTHLMEIWTLWHPTYWLSGAIKLLTAFVSVATAVLLVPIVPKALALPNPAQLEVANQALSQLAALVECSGDAIIGKSLAGIITSWNAGAEKLFGYMAEEAVGQSIAILIPPDYADELTQILEQIKRGEAIERYKTVRVRKDGQRIDIAATISPVKDATGRVIGAAKIARNISDLQQIEASLKQSEARYRAIIEDQTELIVRFQPNGILTFVNDAYCRYFGMKWEELVGHRYEPVVFAEDLEKVAQQVQLMTLENPTVTIENRVVVGGEVRWTQWANRAFFDEQGNLCEFQAVGRDIHKLKQAEEALEQSNRHFRAIFNTMFQFIGLLAPEGILLEANQTALDFGGLTREEVINQPFWEARWWSISSETQAQLKAAIAQAATGQFIRYEVDVSGTGDTVATIDFSLKPIHDETGKVVLLIPEGRDISEQKRTAEQVKASLKEKEVLLKEIHHRVKNNLGVVDGLLQMQARRSQNSEVIEALTESQNRIASIALVHEKLYDSNNLANIDFVQYISDLTAHLFDSYNTHLNQVKLTTQVNAILLDIDTAIPCGLIINELVSNALKYAFPNTRMGEIHVTFQQNQDQTLTLTVADNGIGLPEDFTLKQTKTLGINLVKGLVRQIRGTLEIKNKPGTTAIITFSGGKS